MRIFGLFGKGRRRYVSDEAFRANLERQVSMCPQTLDALREHGVTDQAQLKLDYFFYTDTSKKASALAGDLLARGYSAEHGPSAGGDGTFLVTGCTSRMPIDNATVAAWSEAMCRIGFEHDCEFDGWGTEVEQA